MALNLVGSAAKEHLAVGDLPKVYRAWICWARGDAVGADQIWAHLERRAPDSPTWPRLRAWSSRLGGHHARSEAVVRAAKARGAADDVILALIDQYDRAQLDTAAIITKALRIVDDAATAPASRYSASIVLSEHGRMVDARRGLESLGGNARLGVDAAAQLLALDLIEKDGNTHLIPGWLSPERHHLLKRTGSDTLLVTFIQSMGAFGAPANQVLALFGQTRPNILYLYDSRNLFSLAGAEQFGRDYEAMIRGIETLKRDLGAKRLVTYASCAPGFTAIRAGIDLAADQVIAVAPVTSLREEDMLRDARTPILRQRVAEAVGENRRDLLEALTGRPNGPRIDIYYDPARDRDRWYAERLDGVPTVALHELSSGAADPSVALMQQRERLR